MNAKESTPTIRAFIALELSDETREELSRVGDILKPSGADVKWVSPGSIHLTLKFLGNITEDMTPRISSRLEEIARHISPFDIKLEGLGAFPGWSRPRVIWIGVGQGADRVSELASVVADSMAEEGFEKEKRAFKAHLTIGRVRGPANKARLKALADPVRVTPATSHISRIVLFKSDLSSKGAVYTSLASHDFKN